MSITIGFISLAFAIRIRRPLTCLYIPSLLPMIPGMYAYKTIFSLILFVQSSNSTKEHFQYLMAFMSNGTIACLVLIVLAVGATIPYFIFKRLTLPMTRGALVPEFLEVSIHEEHKSKYLKSKY